MSMTPADLAEGRRLLEAVKAAAPPAKAESWMDCSAQLVCGLELSDWLNNNADALLSEAEAAARLREENRILTASFADGFAAGVQSVVDRVIK